MAFVIPQFNLVCNVWTYPVYLEIPPAPDPATARLVNQPCALVYGHRTNQASATIAGEFGYPAFLMNLLLPKGTDIRGGQDSVGHDAVECPAGSGRYYWVTMVDDIGKGWANEHRSASILALLGSWSAPYP